ncbi:MAG: AMIN domain-containing protein, partial [Thermodesulfobacteriota bacterium]
MKKTIALLISALFLAQNPVFIYAAQAAVVKSVRVSSESVYITTDKPVRYKAFTMSDPPRLIVELDDSRLKTLEEIPVNSVFIRKVRTGQFKTSPVSVSRIVLELTQKAVYDITQKGTEMVVVIGGKFNPKKYDLKDAPAAVQPSAAEPESVKVIAPSPPGAAPSFTGPPASRPADRPRDSA